MKGTVKWFNAEKGYGFIRPEDGENDLFVHITKVKDHKALEPDMEVTFEEGDSPKGKCAINVEIA